MLKKIKFYLIGAAICCLVTGAYYTLKSGKKPDDALSNKHDYIKLTNALLSRLQILWSAGDLEGKYKKNKLNCPEFVQFNPLVAKRYLECNPKFIECIFSNQSLTQDGFHLNLKRVISYRPTKMEFIIENKQAFFKKVLIADFKNHCHQSNLPQTQYTLESLGKKPWSSVKRKIKIDKFLVSENEINIWKPGYQQDILKLGLPALGLTLSDQMSFCQSRGKRLMRAHIFEAATRLKPSSKMSIYPWTHYSVRSKEGLLKAKITKELCSKAYLKECVGKFEWRAFQGDSVSWTQIHDIFGGPPERFMNIFEPELSLKKADETVSMKSINMAKIGFKKQTKGIDPSRVGFRCYTEEQL